MIVKTCFEIIGPEELTREIAHTCLRCGVFMQQVRSMATENAGVTLLIPGCECFEKSDANNAEEEE